MFSKKGNRLHLQGGGDGEGIDFNGMIAAALKQELGSTHQAIKTVARWTGAGERTVKYWFAGSYGPSGENFVALVRNSDSVLKAFLTMANRPGPVLAVQLADLREQLAKVAELIQRQQ